MEHLSTQKTRRSPSSLQRSKKRMKNFIAKKKQISHMPVEPQIQKENINKLVWQLHTENIQFKDELLLQQQKMQEDKSIIHGQLSDAIHLFQLYQNLLHQKEEELLSYARTIKAQEEYIYHLQQTKESDLPNSYHP